MTSTFDSVQKGGLGDGTEVQNVVPTAKTSSMGLFDDIQEPAATMATSKQQSKQPSLGEAIAGAIVLVGGAWLAGEILREIFGSGADLTAVEQQILASA
ncbi:hypothetical protein RH831_11025 [Halodesulfurarchaeum sp. HSR-GB]|uniref:hypothetical protein n=1 Tax=Halodesulfurarchaeum sp. HSR-GB TaxID=3074077 RepID=UPI002859C5BE|nr:hypothetical protein [Halodesulfurarchaeum sp. HSR-GB]MDR5657708.1 hypothetical protein [Halodesulfurarchaeum sp. HSR-GB]